MKLKEITWPGKGWGAAVHTPLSSHVTDLSVNVAVRMQLCPADTPPLGMSLIRATDAPVVLNVPSGTPSPQPLMKNRHNNNMAGIIRDFLLFIVLSSL
jgi:hypothetical protein